MMPFERMNYKANDMKHCDIRTSSFSCGGSGGAAAPSIVCSSTDRAAIAMKLKNKI